MSNNLKGFTLVELLVVVIIIGILAALGLPTFLNQVNKARRAEAITYVGSINRGQQAFYAENLRFSNSTVEIGVGVPDQTRDYTYQINANSSQALATASPTQASLDAVAGKTFLTVLPSGEYRVEVILCPSETSEVPDLAVVSSCPNAID